MKLQNLFHRSSMVKAGNMSKRLERGTLVGNIESGGLSRDYRGGGN